MVFGHQVVENGVHHRGLGVGVTLVERVSNLAVMECSGNGIGDVTLASLVGVMAEVVKRVNRLSKHF